MGEPAISSELSYLLETCFGNNQASEEGIDWNRLYRLAELHRIRPLLSKKVNERGLNVPRDWLTRMTSFRRNQSMYSLLLFEKTIKIYSHLSSLGLAVFPMKGTVWASLYYGDPGMREFGDIDFFLERNQLPDAVDAMRELGFVPDAYRAFLLETEQSAKAYRNTDYQLPLAPIEDPDGELVELQWNVSYPRYAYSFSYEEIMTDSVEYRLMGTTIILPRPEHQLILMIIHHGGVEQWDKLKYVADLLFFLKKHADGLDWNYVERLGKAKGIFKLLTSGLTLAGSLSSEVRFPENFRRKLVDLPLGTIYQHWEKGREVRITKSGQILIHNLQFRDRPIDRLKILAGHAIYLSNVRLLRNKVKWYFFKKA